MRGKIVSKYLAHTLLPSEKGFYAFAFLLALFGAIAVQKNTRDAQQVVRREV